MMEAAMTKALSYLRVSGKGQVEGDGFPRQREAIARYAKTANIEVSEEFHDEGVSGTKDLDDREGLGELMARIRANGVGSCSSSGPTAWRGT
jgi:DNA invertase Pin-like site-specific DNA recombinase